MKRNIITFISACLCVLSVSCINTNRENPADNSLAASRQATVDAMHSIRSGYIRPEVGYDTPDSPRLEGWFDVNTYFSVLNHLSMQSGYTLDYIYHNISGADAHPFLYARKTDSKPYSSLGELAQTSGDASKWYESDHSYDYLAFIKADGSEESFFQLVVLRIMGGQFYLWWHANYNDHAIICDPTGLESIITNFSGQDAIVKMPSAVQEKARHLDFSPKVEISQDTVNVRVVIFTQWGGFIEETYNIARLFPHSIKEVKTQTLVKWNSGLMF
jgi:hypothetical protein